MYSDNWFCRFLPILGFGTLIVVTMTFKFLMKGNTPEHLPRTQAFDDFHSVVDKSSAAGNGKPFVKPPTLTSKQKKQVDEILTIARSKATKFNDAELNNALNDKNELLEEVITQCTENTSENVTVSGEAILKLMMCANNTEGYTDFGLHLKSTIFKIQDSFDKSAENFWNVNLDDAASGIPSSERTKIVDKVSEIVAIGPLTGLLCENLVDSFAKTNVLPFTGKLWYEYVVKNFKAKGLELRFLLKKLDKAVDSKEHFLQIDEFFKKIQEEDMFNGSWSKRTANSFMDYLIRNGKVKHSHLLAYMKNVSDANEEENRFSRICTLITDLDTYQKIMNEIKFGYGTSCTSIPIFDTEILLKDCNFDAKLELLCNTLVELKFDSMLKHSIEKLVPFGLLLLRKHPKFVLNEFHQTRDYVFKICSEDLITASCFLYETSNENRLELLENTTLTDYTEIITISSLNDEMLKIVDEKGKYDKIKEYEVDSPEFEEILKLSSKYEMPNLRSVILSKIENATGNIEKISTDNKLKICNIFINVKTNDEKCSKNIEILMKKNVIPSSFSFPTDISSKCQQTIIDNVTENNINNVLLVNAKSNEIFDLLIQSIHLKDVTPLVISRIFSDKQLKDLDAKNKYMNIPDLKSNDFVILLETGKNKSLFNLMTKLDEVLKTTDISEIEDYCVLKHVFSKLDFTDQLKKLTVDQLIKISENYDNAIEKCLGDVFTDENVL